MHNDTINEYDSGVSAESLKPNQPIAVSIEQHNILIVKLDDDNIVAVTATCPHAATQMQPADCSRGRLICPNHGWKFDLKSGRTLYPEDEMHRLKHYTVRVEKTIKILL